MLKNLSQLDYKHTVHLPVSSQASKATPGKGTAGKVAGKAAVPTVSLDTIYRPGPRMEIASFQIEAGC